MKIQTTTTGSYPPVYYEDGTEAPPAVSVERVISDQLEAGIDILVDGQVRSDIAGLFAPVLGQVYGEVLPYEIVGKIEKVDSSKILEDYKAAQKIVAQLAPQRGRSSSIELKAHITGPTFLAQSFRLKRPQAPYHAPAELAELGSPHDIDSNLIYDIATALAEVARDYYAAGAHIIQIDEPSLAYGADPQVGLDAIGRLTRGAPDATWILHTCGDVRGIFQKLLRDAPVQVLFVEGEHLRELKDLNAEQLNKAGKKILYGCLPVDTEVMPSAQKLERELAETIKRFGTDNVFGISPYCGLRLSKREVALAKMCRLVEAARAVEAA